MRRRPASLFMRRGSCPGGIADDAPVEHAQDALRARGDVGFVGDDDDVLPARCSSSNSARISSPVAVSRLPVASSASSRLGWVTRARAIATRCLCRPRVPRDGVSRVRQPDAGERLCSAQRAVTGGARRRRARAIRRSAAPWRAQKGERLEHEADFAIADVASWLSRIAETRWPLSQ